MHHDTITGTSRQYVINQAISRLEGLLSSNSKKLGLLFMAKTAELGLKIKDFLHHVRPVYNELWETIDLSRVNETLIHVFNPSLDYIDTTFLQIQGSDNLRLFVWQPEA